MSDYREGKAVTWDQMPWEDVRPGVRRTGFGNADVTLVMNKVAPGNQPRRTRTLTSFRSPPSRRGTASTTSGTSATRWGRAR